MAVVTKDLEAEALDRVVEQLRDQANFEALVSLLSEQVQLVQDATLVVLNDTLVADSEGAQLDGLGAIVGEERFGREDIAYRLGILARIRLNLSSGTTEDVIAIVRALAGAVTVRITDTPPASFLVEIVEPIDPAAVNPDIVANFVASARGASIGAQLLYIEDPEADIFMFAAGDAEEASVDQGWADDAQTIGGHMADVIGA